MWYSFSTRRDLSIGPGLGSNGDACRKVALFRPQDRYIVQRGPLLFDFGEKKQLLRFPIPKTEFVSHEVLSTSDPTRILVQIPVRIPVQKILSQIPVKIRVKIPVMIPAQIPVKIPAQIAPQIPLWDLGFGSFCDSFWDPLPERFATVMLRFNLS